jgi:hypothetical protein
VSTPKLHLHTLFVVNGDGRITSTRDAAAGRGPLFCLVRSTRRCAWAVRADVPDHIAKALDGLAREEPRLPPAAVPSRQSSWRALPSASASRRDRRRPRQKQVWRLPSDFVVEGWPPASPRPGRWPSAHRTESHFIARPGRTLHHWRLPASWVSYRTRVAGAFPIDARGPATLMGDPDVRLR